MNDKLLPESENYYVSEGMGGKLVNAPTIYKAAMIWLVQEKYEGKDCGEWVFVWREGQTRADGLAMYVRVEGGELQVAVVKFPLEAEELAIAMWTAGAALTNKQKVKADELLEHVA